MNKTRCICREKIVAVGILALFSFVFMNTAEAHRYAHKHKSAGQHTIQCSVSSNSKGGPCDALYIFPRSTRTVMIADIMPGKKYQCYFSGYHTWSKEGAKNRSDIVRDNGLIGLSISKLMYERGSDISAKIKSSFTLRNPLKIDASDSKHGGSMTFVIKNHTSGDGNYVTISCTEVNTFSN